MSRSWHYGKWCKHPIRERHPCHYKWYAKEPKWWRKMMKHKKRRQSARHSSHLCMKDLDNGLEIMWHLDKKPWIYYW